MAQWIHLLCKRLTHPSLIATAKLGQVIGSEDATRVENDRDDIPDGHLRLIESADGHIDHSF